MPPRLGELGAFLPRESAAVAALPATAPAVAAAAITNGEHAALVSHPAAGPARGSRPRPVARVAQPQFDGRELCAWGGRRKGTRRRSISASTLSRLRSLCSRCRT